MGALVFLAVPARASCFDGVKNGPESDVDCGGDCPACERGQSCGVPDDCYSGRCAEGLCAEQEREPGEAVPDGYRVEPSEADSAAITRTIGWISLGVGYGAAYASELSLPGQLGWLLAPVVGPWIKVADSSQERRGLIAVDGLFQTVGAALVVGGIVASGEQLVRDAPTRVSWDVTPMLAGKDGCGVWVVGTF